MVRLISMSSKRKVVEMLHAQSLNVLLMLIDAMVDISDFALTICFIFSLSLTTTTQVIVLGRSSSLSINERDG